MMESTSVSSWERGVFRRCATVVIVRRKGEEEEEEDEPTGRAAARRDSAAIDIMFGNGTAIVWREKLERGLLWDVVWNYVVESTVLTLSTKTLLPACHKNSYRCPRCPDTTYTQRDVC